MPKSILHFKSKAGYKKYLAFGNIHHVFHGGKPIIYIHGKKHKVHHKR